MTSGDVITGGQMSEETKGGADGSTPEKNVKAEFERKLGNTESKLTEIEKQNKMLSEQLSALISAVQKPVSTPTTGGEKLSEVLYDNPDKFVATVEERISKRVEQTLSTREAEAIKRNSVIADLTNSYPELTDSNSALTKLALEHYNAMSAEEKSSPISYKLAVTQAASELRVPPKAKRSDSDDFVMTGKGSTGESRRRTKDEIPDKVLRIAEMFGRDTSDPKVRERLKKYSGRKNWNHYKADGEE